MESAAQYCFASVPRVWTGPGCLGKLGDEVRLLGAARVLVVSDRIIESLGVVGRVKDMVAGAGASVDTYLDVSGEPSFDQIEQAAGGLTGEYDLIVGVGGGSSLDTAKGLSLRLKLGGPLTKFAGTEMAPREGIPLILIPTTSGSGSEVTPIAIFTDKVNGVKTGVVSRFIRAKTAIIDPELTIGLPPRVTAHTGVDALTHAVEAYVSRYSSPTSDVFALEAIRLISTSLRHAVHNGKDITGRTSMSIASMYAGWAFANAGVGAVHALAYPLGGRFGIPHGLANALLLVEVCRFNIPACPERFAEIGRAMGLDRTGPSVRHAADAAVEAIGCLARDVGIPRGLRDEGVLEESIPSMSEEASKISRLLGNNPRAMSATDIEVVYRRAF